MKTLLEQALELRDLLSDKYRWTRMTLAVDAFGEDVAACDPAACQFCLVGGAAKIIACDDPKLKRRLADYPDSAYSLIDKSDLGKLLAATIVGIEKWEPATVTAFEKKPGVVGAAASDFLYKYNDSRSHEGVMDVLNTAVEIARGAEG